MPHPDLDRLLEALLPFARLMVGKRGGFLPFGASVQVDGEVVLDGTLPGEGSDPAAEMLAQLRDGLASAAANGMIRAAGTCVQTRVQRPGTDEEVDAILAHVEHEDGDCLDVYLPYRRGWFRRVSYGDTRAVPGEPSVFAARSEDADSEAPDPKAAAHEPGAVPLEERRHGGARWELELPLGWSFRDDGGQVAIAARPPCGTLALTEHTFPGEVTEEDALQVAARSTVAAGDREPATLGDFKGFAIAGEIDDTWQRQWWVWSGRCLLSVSYTCRLTTQGLEDRGVNRILATLRARDPA